MMVDLYRSFDTPLTHETLSEWHNMLMNGRQDRTHVKPMQVVSGTMHKPTVHFEVPPSSHVGEEMEGFVQYFEQSREGEEQSLPALTRAGIAHLYFVSIHPFEDGNGRIGRAIAEKSLAQSLGHPTLIALAYTIERNRKAYYEQLELNNKDNDITGWLVYFGTEGRVPISAPSD